MSAGIGYRDGGRGAVAAAGRDPIGLSEDSRKGEVVDCEGTVVAWGGLAVIPFPGGGETAEWLELAPFTTVFSPFC